MAKERSHKDGSSRGEITDGDTVGQLQHRLGGIERKLEPGAVIVDEQTAAISNSVKAIAESLLQRDPSKNHYQAIFRELYRRFRITS